MPSILNEKILSDLGLYNRFGFLKLLRAKGKISLVLVPLFLYLNA